MHLEQSIIVDAPADAVWEVLAHRFADVGVWASAIPQSHAVARAGASEPSGAFGGAESSGAPGNARTCHVAAPGFERVTERITAYDEERHSFTYVAAAGMPGMVESASNTWTVDALDAERCQVRTSAELRMRGITRFAAPLMAVVLRRLGRQSLADLKHYAETGRPSAAKTRAVQRASAATSALTNVVRANAMFCAASGTTLAVGAGIWANDVGDAPPAVLAAVGAALVAYAAAVALIGWRHTSAPVGRVLASLDAGWVIASLALLTGYGERFSFGGTAALLIVALIVGTFGALQWRYSSVAGRTIRSLSP